MKETYGAIPCPALPNRAPEEIPKEITVPLGILLTLKRRRIRGCATQIARYKLEGKGNHERPTRFAFSIRGEEDC